MDNFEFIALLVALVAFGFSALSLKPFFSESEPRQLYLSMVSFTVGYVAAGAAIIYPDWPKIVASSVFMTAAFSVFSVFWHKFFESAMTDGLKASPKEHDSPK